MSSLVVRVDKVDKKIIKSRKEDKTWKKRTLCNRKKTMRVEDNSKSTSLIKRSMTRKLIGLPVTLGSTSLANIKIMYTIGRKIVYFPYNNFLLSTIVLRLWSNMYVNSRWIKMSMTVFGSPHAFGWNTVATYCHVNLRSVKNPNRRNFLFTLEIGIAVSQVQ